MGYEIDWHAVGDESQSGDAISMRWGDLYGRANDQTIVVIDGGFSSTGDEIAEHIDKYYGMPWIDLMVSTHPDNDHINGLLTLMDRRELTISRLWLHQPWKHNLDAYAWKAAAGARGEFEKGTFERYVANARALYDAAISREVIVEEPFTGVCFEQNGGVLRVVGPTVDYYRTLVPDFGRSTGKPSSLLAKVAAATRASFEGPFLESLTDDGTTSAPNNSSAITYLQHDNHEVLFTGDAGIPALDAAADALSATPGYVYLDHVDVPHHGSRHNVGPSVLNRLLGPKGNEDRQRSAVCSSAAKNPDKKRPAKMVTNAFRRRGYPVTVTAGRTLSACHNAPERPAWSSVTPEPLYDKVEDFDT